MSGRDSFVFYRSFFEAAIPLNDKEKLSLLNTICEYALNNKIGELEPMAKAMFCLIKPNLDANTRKYENGSKGGRPKKNETKEEPKNNLNETKEEPNHKLMNNVDVLCIMNNDDVDDNEDKKENGQKRDLSEYSFVGNSFKILRKDYQEWVTNFLEISITPKLQKYDEMWKGAPPDGWFFKIAAMLRKDNEAQILENKRKGRGAI